MDRTFCNQKFMGLTIKTLLRDSRSASRTGHAAVYIVSRIWILCITDS